MKSETKEKTKTGAKLNSVVPLGDRILLRPFNGTEEKEANALGIIIPETVDKDKPEKGTVLAVGAGRYDDGKLVPMRVKVGDIVVFSKYGYDEITVAGEELYILKEDSILAIIK